jgi:hypothetical protein
MLMISLKTKMVAMNGCAVLMEANVPTEMPARLVDTAIEKGCIPANSYTPANEAPVEPEEATAEDTRGADILAAVSTVVEEGIPANFGKDGTPKVKAVEKVLGYDISAAERDVAWEVIHED